MAQFLRRTESLHNQFHNGLEINQERSRGCLHGQVQNTSRFNQEWNRGIRQEQRKMEAKRGQEQRNKGPQWKGKRKAIVPFQKTQIPTEKKLVSITGKNEFQSNGRHNPKRNSVGKEIWRRKGQQESSKQDEDKGKKGQGVQENIENIQIQPVGNGWLDRSAVVEEEESFRFIPPSKNTMIAGSSSGEKDDDVDLSDRNKMANSTNNVNDDVEDNNVIDEGPKVILLRDYTSSNGNWCTRCATAINEPEKETKFLRYQSRLNH
ncbi:hypothetical protein RHMOL_Rhmol06G0288500 [Rhododendron molle]|uniref:Uncharacterized protein n=1 Tax=Rhododendron molle TaxID=49168 RepID=A0ACC0NJE2_RHOML|nr:hypothetical protein RHMOL_Rhmol06G0288500 [Rhododendron molle]